MNEKLIITVNSAIIYIVAFLLTTIIHEFLHAIIGLNFESNPVLHHNFVQHLSIEHLTVNQKISIAIAGPQISLVQGFISGFIYYKAQKKSHKLIHLFLLWFSVLGFFNFLGYLMTGLFFNNGDIGRVYLMVNSPISIQIFIAMVASILLVWVAYKMTVPYLQFSYQKDWVKNGKSKKNFSFHILFLPWIIGSIIITILYLPVIAVVSIIYPIMSGMIFIFPWQNANRIKEVALSTNREIGKLSLPALGFLIILAFLFKLILAPGINL